MLAMQEQARLENFSSCPTLMTCMLCHSRKRSIKIARSKLCHLSRLYLTVYALGYESFNPRTISNFILQDQSTVKKRGHIILTYMYYQIHRTNILQIN